MIEFIYDAFDRCLSIKNNSQQKNLIYQYDQEIGSSESNKLEEIKIISEMPEKVFALELNGKTYFLLQDHHNNICALRDNKGRSKYEKDHIHFKDGSALNYDGTWKHGSKSLTKSEAECLKSIGWNLSKGT